MKEVIKSNLKIGGYTMDDDIRDHLSDLDIYALFKDNIINHDYSFLDREDIKENIRRRLQYMIVYGPESDIESFIYPELQSLITSILIYSVLDGNSIYNSELAMDRILELSHCIKSYVSYDEEYHNYEFENKDRYDIIKKVIDESMIKNAWHYSVRYIMHTFGSLDFSFSFGNIIEIPPEDFKVDNIIKEEYIKELIRRLKNERDKLLSK